jgi:hypothetical protein
MRREYYKQTADEEVNDYTFTAENLDQLWQIGSGNPRFQEAVEGTSETRLFQELGRLQPTSVSQIASFQNAPGVFLTGGRFQLSSNEMQPGYRNAQYEPVVWEFVIEFFLGRMISPALDKLSTWWLQWRNTDDNHRAHYNPIWHLDAQEDDGFTAGSEEAVNSSMACQVSPDEVARRYQRNFDDAVLTFDEFRTADGRAIAYAHQPLRLGGQDTGFADVANLTVRRDNQGTLRGRYSSVSSV